MRQLEVVAVSDDGNHVLLASSEDAKATHQLRITNRLVAAINGELDDEDEHRESELSPKEIQARLRAGDSVEQVARAARIPVARIMIYATPVISERERIIDQARSAKMRRPRGPEITTSLGNAATKRLTEVAGLKPETVEWTAKRREDAAWVISLAFAAKGGTRTAQWLWRPNGRDLTALNALASRMGSLEAAAPPRKPRPAAAAAPVRRTAPRKTSTTRGTAAKRTAAAPPAKRSAAARTAAKPAVRRPRPEPRQAPVREQIKTADGRIVVPSWDDVLLGVTSPVRGRRRS